MPENRTPEVNCFLGDDYENFRRSFWSMMNSRQTVSIAKVTGISTITSGTVDIQPLVQHFDKNSGFVDYPEIKGVPITQMASPQYSINVPVNLGDVGLVLWVDREVFTWLFGNTSGSHAPESGEMNNANDCIFIPFLQKFSKAPVLKQTGLEFMSAGIKLMQELITMTTNMASFAQSLNTAATNPSSQVVLPATAGSIPVVIPAFLVSLASASNTFVTNSNLSKQNLTTFKGQQ
jgi:hypothetical protein